MNVGLPAEIHINTKKQLNINTSYQSRLMAAHRYFFLSSNRNRKYSYRPHTVPFKGTVATTNKCLLPIAAFLAAKFVAKIL